MKKNLSFLAMMTILGLIACTYEKVEVAQPASSATLTCDTFRTISYSADIVPFLSSTCGSSDINCHNSSASSMVPLDVYVGVQYFGQDGQLMNSLNWTGGASHMPKNQPKLEPCKIAMILKWVNEGEPNN
ncbi:MAG: hypothetical protein ACJ77K_00140 [Bacteroidia bacterium]